jgi:hypothetical protein
MGELQSINASATLGATAVKEQYSRQMEQALATLAAVQQEKEGAEALAEELATKLTEAMEQVGGAAWAGGGYGAWCGGKCHVVCRMWLRPWRMWLRRWRMWLRPWRMWLRPWRMWLRPWSRMAWGQLSAEALSRLGVSYALLHDLVCHMHRYMRCHMQRFSLCVTTWAHCPPCARPPQTNKLQEIGSMAISKLSSVEVDYNSRLGAAMSEIKVLRDAQEQSALRLEGSQAQLVTAEHEVGSSWPAGPGACACVWLCTGLGGWGAAWGCSLAWMMAVVQEVLCSLTGCSLSVVLGPMVEVQPGVAGSCGVACRWRSAADGPCGRWRP